MDAYKFETIVQDDGIINIPEMKALVNHKIEILIIDLTEKNNEKKQFKTFKEFSRKWKGCIKGINIDNYKEERITQLEAKHK